MDYVNYYHFVTRSRASLRGYATLIASKLLNRIINPLGINILSIYRWDMEYRIISKKKKKSSISLQIEKWFYDFKIIIFVYFLIYHQSVRTFDTICTIFLQTVSSRKVFNIVSFRFIYFFFFLKKSNAINAVIFWTYQRY